MKRKSLFIRALMAISFLFSPFGVLAGTDTWTGGGGEDIFWHTANNWGGVAPVQGDFLIFTGTSSLIVSNNYPAGTYFGGITFQSPAGAFVLEGRPLALTNVTDTQAITPQTIDLSLIASNTITVDTVNASILDINGEIHSPIGTTSGVTMTGSGTVNLNYDPTNQTTNIFTGTLEVDGGTVVPASDLSLGTTNDLTSLQAGRLVLNGGALEASGNLTINPNRGIALGSVSGSDWGGLNINSGRTLNYDGVIADGGTADSLVMSGFGNLVLSGQNTYSGATSNQVGTLTLDFSQTGAPANNIINSASTLVLGGGSAGAGVESFAQLTVTGAVSAVNSQAFNATHVTTGNAYIQSISGSSGSANLDLGLLDHDAGGTLTIVPAASGSLHTTAANINGILGGWAAISSGANARNFFVATNWASVDGSGNIVNFSDYMVYNSAATFMRDSMNAVSNIYVTGLTTSFTNDVDGANSTNDVNSIVFNALPAGIGFIVGSNDVIRLGQYGGLMKKDTGAGNNWHFGDNGQPGDQTNMPSYLTAGGPNYNTPGEIVLINTSTGSSSSQNWDIDSRIIDNGPSGPVTVIKTGSGYNKFRNHNSYSGGTYLLGGRLQLVGSDIGTPVSDGLGTGPVYIFPGAYLFGDAPDNPVIYIAGIGTAQENDGALRLGGGAFFTNTVVMFGDSGIGGGGTNDPGVSPNTPAVLAGPVSGNFNMYLGAFGNVGGGGNGIILSNQFQWTGDTYIVARTSNGSKTRIMLGENNALPSGFGYGNLYIGAPSVNSANWCELDLRGYDQTVNGLFSGGTSAAATANNIVCNSANSTTSTLTFGNNDQSGLWGGVIRNTEIFHPGNTGIMAVTKIGGGVETFTNANTYSGNTTISNGVLQLTGSGSINNSPLVDIEGGTFDVSAQSYTIPAGQSVNADGGSFKISTASSASGGSLNLTNGTLEIGQASAVANYTGTLNLGGVTNIIRVDNFPKEGEWPHTFPVVNYTTLNGDISTVGGQFPSIAYQGYFSNDLTTSTIYVVITNGPITVSVVWGGSVNGTWDNQTTPNFEFAGMATNYFDGDIVTFPDVNVGSQYNVNVSDDFSPGGVTVSNNVGHTYTFSGTGSLNGTNSVVKDGTGTWILDNSAGNNGGINDLSGGISILAGTLQVGNGDANGDLGYDSSHGYNPVANNGTLVFDRSDTPTVGNTISGSGNVVQSAGILTLSGGNSFGGTVEVQSGATLVAGNNSALGLTNSGTTIDSGGTLDVSGGGLGANALNLGAEAVTVSGTGVGGNGAIINGSATVSQQKALQQVTLAGDTTVGGASSWGIVGGSLNGAYNLAKVGSATLSLSNVVVDPNLSNIDVQAGTLDIGGTTTGLGNSGDALTVESGASLQLDNATNQLNKQITLNGDGLANTLNDASGNDTIIGPMTLNGSVIVNSTNGTTLTLDDTISGTGSLTKNGTNSTVIFTGTNNYSGATTINDGTVLIDGINSGSQLTENYSQTLPLGSVIVGGSGTNAAPMDVEDVLWPGVGGKPATFGVGDGVNYYSGDASAGALDFGYVGGGAPEVIFSLGSSTTAGSGVNDLVTVHGDFNGNFAKVKLNPLAPLSTSAPYTLVTYTGAKDNNFSGTIGVVDSLQPTRYTFSLDYSTAHEVLLDVLTGAGSLVWNNAASTGIWDINTSANWLNTGTSANDVFYQLDSVTFDDSVLTGPTNTVTVATNVSPGSVKVNTTNNYVLTGTGKITGGTGLEKDGSGALIVGNTGNDFTGAAAINAGTVVVNAANALGSGTVTVTSGATLDVGGPALALNAAVVLGAQPIVVSGWGVNSNGAIINSSVNGQQNAIQNITLAGDTAFGGPGFAQMPNNPGRWDMRGGTPTLSTSGNAYNLYKVGPSQLSLVGVTVDTNLADIHVYGGEFGVEVGTSPTLGNPTNTITMDTGTSLEMYNFAGPLDKNLIVNGGQMLDNSNRPNIWFNAGSYPSNTIASPVTVTNGIVAIGGAGSGTFSNVISGNGSLLICGGVTLVNANTYSGDTIVSNNGSLFLVGSATIDTSTNIVLGGGAATLDASGRSDSTLTLAATSSQTLSGGGTVNGSLSSPAGTTVTVGTTNTLGVLTITTNASLAGATDIKLDPANKTNDVLAAAGMLTYGGTLNVTNISAFTLGANQSQTFKVFNATTYSGSFSSIQLPTIAGIAWDTTQLAVNGTITANSTLTPTPVITSISLSGTTLDISATNGSVNGQYTLLESTNVALPLAQWTPVLTNNFDGSGNINLSTNIVDPNLPETFYILQMP